MPVRSSLNMALGILALGILTLGCLGATLAHGQSPGAEQSLLYPWEVRARPVVVVSGGSFARRYWDPRYAQLCPWSPARHRWQDRPDP